MIMIMKNKNLLNIWIKQRYFKKKKSKGRVKKNNGLIH